MSFDSECIFCKIIQGQIKAKLISQNEHVLAFYDINPQSPTHIIIIPKTHVPSVNELSDTDAHFFSSMLLMAKELGLSLGFKTSGYRLVINTQKDAGQSVFHIHMHFLAGREFSWPPG